MYFDFIYYKKNCLAQIEKINNDLILEEKLSSLISGNNKFCLFFNRVSKKFIHCSKNLSS
jgi:hypothetical protein